MKRLWKHIPPCLSDCMGFQAVMTQTDGLGIIDDPGRYKPLETLGVGDATPMSMTAGRPDIRHQSGGFDGIGAFKGHGGGSGRPGGGRQMVAQVTDSALRNEDIISGSENKIVQAYEEHRDSSPKFVLICNAPSSAMISSDVDSAAIRISESGNIPAGKVKVYGEKDYLFGVSMTLEAIAKLLLEKQETIQGSVNILGCNIVDWNEAAVKDLTGRLEKSGLTVIGKWGAAGMSLENIKKASAASVNLVVNISGLKAAKYMESEFGIPYVVGAPYGSKDTDEIISLIKDINASGKEGAFNAASENNESSDPEILIVGEQLAANAIRRNLRNMGYKNICVTSFFEMDKAYMEEGDRKLQSEDELFEYSSGKELKAIIANPDYKGAASGNVRWISLPNSGMSIMEKVNPVNMVGDGLDQWLKDKFAE